MKICLRQLSVFHSKCMSCKNLRTISDLLKSRSGTGANQALCKFCVKSCILCMRRYASKKNFTINADLCDSCAVMRKASIENTYFRFPQLRYAAGFSQIADKKKQLVIEKTERDIFRTSHGMMPDAEIRERYYSRHRHRPM